MLDFKELAQNGDAFELLIREILLVKGFHVQWSGKGADGGRDLICHEDRASEFQSDRKTWLIQCKHNAHSGNSVGISDLDDIISSCAHHEADAYLLVCSTVPSSAVVNRLESIDKNLSYKISATYWDATIIEQKLSTPSLWRIAQLFFPISSAGSTWEIYATENPNQWIVNYRGYHFHLSNRVGSNGRYHFESIDARINEIQELDKKLPENHFIRIRSVYYDDKNGGYTWFIDYMFPRDESPAYYSAQIARAFGDGYALEDGQIYSFDVVNRPYSPHSDHYDKDHYAYYGPHSLNFTTGIHRSSDEKYSNKRFQEELAFEKQAEENQWASFNKLKDAFKTIPFIKLVRAVNSSVEHIDKFVRIRDWEDITRQHNIDLDNVFSAWFLIEVGEHKEDFLKLLSYFSYGAIRIFRLGQVYLFSHTDDSGLKYDDDETSLFDFHLSINQGIVHTAEGCRKELNEYFDECTQAIEKFRSENSHLVSPVS